MIRPIDMEKYIIKSQGKAGYKVVRDIYNEGDRILENDPEIKAHVFDKLRSEPFKNVTGNSWISLYLCLVKSYKPDLYKRYTKSVGYVKSWFRQKYNRSL